MDATKEKLGAECSWRETTASQYAIPYMASALLIALGLTAYRLAYSSLGELGFAEYALMRRTAAFCLPLLLLGSAVSVPRFVARESSHRVARFDYLIAALLLIGLALGVWSAAVWSFPGLIAFICCGDATHGPLIRSLTPLLSGLLATQSVTAYCRGRKWLAASYGTLVLNLGVVPVVVLLNVDNVVSFFQSAGLGMLATTAIALLLLAYRERPHSRRFNLEVVRKLFVFGAPRVPGDLAYYGLLAAPAIVVAHREGVERGGGVAYALSVVVLSQQVVAPLSGVFLPMASALLGSQHVRLLRRRVVRAAALTTTVSILVAGVIELLADSLVAIHLGADVQNAATAIRWLAPSIVPLNLFVCLRNIVDAGEDFPVAPVVCLTALALFLVSTLFPPLESHGNVLLLCAFNGSALMLALLIGAATLRVLRRAIAQHEPVPADCNLRTEGRAA